MGSELDELGRQHSPAVLGAELRADHHVVYSDNGNRATRGRVFLNRLERLRSLTGVRRVGDISALGESTYPVFQSCRPNLFFHADYVQNTNAQGKGGSATQAKISCLMESIEVYCSEPRAADLMRASFRFLSEQHVVLDPRTIVARRAARRASPVEPLMWTPAYSVRLGRPAWVPAELVYYPFIASSYRTRPIFVIGSNGLASGGTYLEAVIHALYELVERYYQHELEAGRVRLEALFEKQLAHPGVDAYLRKRGPQSELQLYSVELPGVHNLPVIMCCLMEGGLVHVGWGCSGSVDMSIGRAFSEALQAQATVVSGAREDVALPSVRARAKSAAESVLGRTRQPGKRTLSREALSARVADHAFATLRAEYDFLLQWLAALGYDNIFLANLTRHGIDIPVVKAIIPQLQVPEHFRRPSRRAHRSPNPFERQYRNMNPRAR